MHDVHIVRLVRVRHVPCTIVKSGTIGDKPTSAQPNRLLAVVDKFPGQPDSQRDKLEPRFGPTLEFEYLN